ncbi:heterokaryon incompatibility protein-domain-containing protein [Colletotrichum acutatum]|uniref:Heterokaryon incompatibility protein-domain-containing protein n=1 Tax=Glomerella acutata TaxID=27357 RepID=A0AAD8XK10_GLOAC|nr:heterokaryon incompatibility protein-domain-containing protein [Colletotrichum acutatum]KAK1728685.1 heterokaryon incompatibility protein-domain-containing protein [Colletotrichum acutatum]
MDSEESEESYSSINDNLCDECYDAVIFHDGGDEFYEGTNRDDEPTLRHSEEGGDIIDLDSVRRWNDTLPDLPMMTESAAAGCRMCGFLREELLRQKICHIGETYIEAGYLFGGQGYEFEIIDTDPGLAFWRCEVYGVKKTTYNPDGFKSITSLTFDIESCDKDLHQWLRVHTKPAPGPLDPASVEWVQSQLQRCDYHCDHGKPELPFIPTRLIYVGQNEDDAPRLVIVENMLDSGMIDALEYATLSYCWGSKEDALQQVTTTNETILTNCQGIPLGSLSPVVRDTIKVCRAIGISYLWVDALCIIQGDNVDWDRESQMMGQIYHSCYVTICPLSSRSCLEGYLGSRPQGFEVEFQSSRHENIRGTYRLVHSSTGLDEYDALERPALHRDLERSSWNNRGWTFQESLLSPRIIYFGSHMSHFVCEDVVTSENGDMDRNFIHGRLQITVRRALGKPHMELDCIANINTNVYSCWESVHKVQRRAWTCHEDIFPGLAGIAQAFATLTSDTYLAGLWKNDLHHQLVWHMPRPPAGELASVVHGLQHADPYIAPSWSWASRTAYQESLIIREISIDNNEVVKGNLVRSNKSIPCQTRFDLALIDYRMDLRDKNCFGALTGGFLRLKGRICPFPSDVRKGLKPHGDSRRLYGQFSGGIGACMLDWNVNETLVQAPESMRLLLVSSCCSATVSWKNLKFRANCDDEDFDDWMPSEAEVGGTSFPNGYEDIDVCRYCADPMHKRTGYGLVIHPAEEPGSYVRVGVFVMFAHKGGMYLFKDEAEEIKLI